MSLTSGPAPIDEMEKQGTQTPFYDIEIFGYPKRLRPLQRPQSSHTIFDESEGNRDGDEASKHDLKEPGNADRTEAKGRPCKGIGDTCEDEVI